MMPLSAIGERGLILRILRRHRMKRPRGLRVLVPNGDDAFVARFPKNRPLVFTTDTLVEGTHFDFKLMRKFLSKKASWEALGVRAMAANLSDLAAMGNVRPILAFCTVGLHGDISVDYVDRLFTGMARLLGKTGGFLAGGDIIRAEKSMVSITLVGESSDSHLKRRSGAKIGQVLMASGPLGLSMAGLEILSGTLKTTPPNARFLVQKHLFPRPRLDVPSKISGAVSAMMDTSDDLMSSLEILSEESGVGFDIDVKSVPIHPALKKLPVPALRFVLSGGEDYELLFTTAPSNVKSILKKIPGSFVLGKVKPKPFGIGLRDGSRPFEQKDARFRHF